ncbi:MAG: hypothetical protein ABIK09_13760 [Pseudomonadota bacterium]
MRRILTLLMAIAAVALFWGCSGDGGGGGTLDVGGELAADVPAHDINPYEEQPEEYCKGFKDPEQFSAFNWQCEEVIGLGKCVIISESHYPEESFYCAVCGLKGAEMICYFIQQK